MDLIINGKPRKFNKTMSVPDLLSSLKVAPDKTAVEVNGKIIEQNERQSLFLKSGDKIEIITFVGGG